MQKILVVAGLSAILMMPGSPGWGAEPMSSVDFAGNLRVWETSSRPGTDDIIAVWLPQRVLSTAELLLVGECSRADDLGVPVGKNRITFRNILLTGVDSRNTVDAAPQRRKLRGGIQRDLAVWMLTDAARELFAEDSAIVIAGEIKVGGTVAGLDNLICTLGVTERLDTSGSRSSAELERFEGRLPAVDGVDLPRLLKARGGR